MTLTDKKQEVFNTIKKLKDERKSYSFVAKHLNNMGFRKVTGRPLCSSSISNFMAANGFRVNVKHKRRSKSLKVATPQRQVVKSRDTETFLLEVLATKLLDSNQKIKVMTALID